MLKMQIWGCSETGEALELTQPDPGARRLSGKWTAVVPQSQAPEPAHLQGQAPLVELPESVTRTLMNEKREGRFAKAKPRGPYPRKGGARCHLEPDSSTSNDSVHSPTEQLNRNRSTFSFSANVKPERRVLSRNWNSKPFMQRSGKCLVKTNWVLRQS